MTKHAKIYLIVLICLTAVTFAALAYFYSIDIKDVKIPMAGNIHDVNFTKLADDLVNVLKPDNRMILASGRYFNIRVLPNGDFSKFQLDIGSVIDSHNISYSGSFNEKGYLFLQFDQKMPIAGNVTGQNLYFQQTFALFDRIPWDHLRANIFTYGKDLMIDNENMYGPDFRVNIADKTSPAKAFIVEIDGSIRQITENVTLSQKDYGMLGFTPQNEPGEYSSKYELQYYFRLYPE